MIGFSEYPASVAMSKLYHCFDQPGNLWSGVRNTTTTRIGQAADFEYNLSKGMLQVTDRAQWSLMEKSLKNQAEEIIVAVDRDLDEVESNATRVKQEVDAKANVLMNTIFGAISDVDIDAATARVDALRAQYPDASPAELSQRLIREKCQRTGTVGAVTSGAGLIPGLGTAAALTLGVAADIGATFKLQAELVLEIAALYNYPLSEDEKQQLVMVITGLSAGTNALARRAGQAATFKLGEKFAEKSILKALPIIGVIASAGTNALSTYIIGQRADAYFRLGPDAVGTWADSLRAVSGVDERQLGGWLAESGRATGAVIVSGASMVGEAGWAAGEAVASGAGKVAETVGAGAVKAGQSARAGLRAYFRWVFAFWAAVFRGIGRFFGFIWNMIMFIPRKIAGLFRRKKR
jgi:hypothetical protein